MIMALINYRMCRLLPPHSFTANNDQRSLQTFQLKANFSLKIVAKVEGSKDGYIAELPGLLTTLPGKISLLYQLLMAYQVE